MNLSAYVGTGGGSVIYLAKYDGKSLTVKEAAECASPSFLALSPDGKFLYSIVEGGAGYDGGALRSYSVAPDGSLKFINEELVKESGLCHVTISSNGRYAVCSSYNGGFAPVFPLNADGSVAPMSKNIVHKAGEGKDSRVHQAMFTPDESMVALVNIGLDYVAFYDFCGDSGVGDERFIVNLPEGSGPRHMVFGQDGYFYVCCEYSNEVIVCRLENGGAKIVRQYDALRGDGVQSYCGAIRMTRDNRLFVSNRGEENIVIFDVKQNGELANKRNIDCGGSFTRDMEFNSDETLLIVANQLSNTVCIFEYKDGVLNKLPPEAEVQNVTGVLWRK